MFCLKSVQHGFRPSFLLVYNDAYLHYSPSPIKHIKINLVHFSIVYRGNRIWPFTLRSSTPPSPHSPYRTETTPSEKNVWCFYWVKVQTICDSQGRHKGRSVVVVVVAFAVKRQYSFANIARNQSRCETIC